VNSYAIAIVSAVALAFAAAAASAQSGPAPAPTVQAVKCQDTTQAGSPDAGMSKRFAYDLLLPQLPSTAN
jgi:hypothetical protein